MGYVEKDFLMRYFNQLGIVLARLLGYKENGQFEEANQVIDDALLDFGLKVSDYYLSIDKSILITELIETQKLSIDQIKILSELFYEKAQVESEMGNIQSGKEFYDRALNFFYYLTKVDKVYSFEREEKIRRIESILET
jgi:hypothetical protein